MRVATTVSSLVKYQFSFIIVLVIMTMCSVFGCTNRSEQSQSNISFHKFPIREKSPKRYNAWLKRINRKDFNPGKHACVCSVHFTEEDYEQSCFLKSRLLKSKFRKILKRHAVPSLHLRGQKKSHILLKTQKKDSTYARKKVVREAILDSEASSSFQCCEVTYEDLVQEIETGEEKEPEEESTREPDNEQTQKYNNLPEVVTQCKMDLELYRNFETECDSCSEGTTDLDKSVHKSFVAPGIASSIDFRNCESTMSMEAIKKEPLDADSNGNGSFEQFCIKEESYTIHDICTVVKTEYDTEDPLTDNAKSDTDNFQADEFEPVKNEYKPEDNLCSVFIKCESDIPVYETDETGVHNITDPSTAHTLEDEIERKKLPVSQNGKEEHDGALEGISRVYSTTDDLRKEQFLDQNSFVCCICNKSFSEEALLESHKRFHNTEKKFPCDKCNKVLRSKKSLIEHELVHTSERPFTCEICLRTYKRKSCYNRHQRVHIGERPYTCGICNKSFSEKRNYHYHLTTHTNEYTLITCKICDKSFEGTINFEEHLRMHVSETPIS